ncbi:MAG: undecaprenyl/decaprenyl-phosphate alpha-N-acetylglucosaminyl 1-phosphate transferase [Bacteroidetes bacterium]|nr:undecaprenyl/decaprenyl-phosphate alpha-N-acetylglucosaminyl 1-phosphate transferase [Bacteroidota bacterium]
MLNNTQAILSLFFIGVFIFSLSVFIILLRFSKNLGVRGKDVEQIRWNPKTKPSIGGIGFYISFLVGFVALHFIPTNPNSESHVQMIGILVAATLAFLMGLADDAYNTQPLLKFLIQIICGLILVFTGYCITVFNNSFLNVLITIMWVVGIMNSINMLDNMDAISTIVSICILSFAIVVCNSIGQINSALNVLLLSVLASLTTFLIFNFHPSKMFMGDTGSQFIGLLLAIIGIKFCWNINQLSLNYNLPPYSNLLILGLVFILPITDTTTVVINRIRKGHSPFIGGKDHTTHHLFFRGVTEKRIAMLFMIIGLIAITLAYNLLYFASFGLILFSLIFFLIIFLLLYLNTVLFKK